MTDGPHPSRGEYAPDAGAESHDAGPIVSEAGPIAAAVVDEPAEASDPRVQAALERIADSAGIDLAATPEVFEDVYRRLNSALARPETA